MATVMAIGYGNVDSNGDRDVNGNGDGNGHWVMAMAMATMTKRGMPLHVLAMCSTVAGQHLASTPMNRKESAFTSAASWGQHC
jgi:hypothetical protein